MTNGIYGSVRRALALVIALVMVFGCMGFASAETGPAEPLRGGAGAGYYLIGSMTGWELDGNYKLSVNPGNANEYMITTNIPANTQYKVVYSANGSSKDTWYPGGDNLTINDAGNYTFYFQSTWNSSWNGYVYVAYNGAPVYGINVATVGTGTAIYPETAAVGESITVTFNPGYGCYVKSVTGTPATWNLSGNTGTFTMPSSDVNLTVTFAQYPTLSANGTNGGGTVLASVPFAAAGTPVTVTVTLNEGYEIASITGMPAGATESNGVYSFNMPDEDVNIAVTFRMINYAITTSATGTGTGTVYAPAAATFGENVSVTVTPNADSKLQKLTVDGVDVTAQVNNGAYAFSMPSHAVAIEAQFRPVGTSAHSITVQISGLGTAFADKTEAVEGELVTITAEASIGYEFAEIVVNDVGQGHGVTTFEMPDEDVTVMVYFDNKPYAITLNSGVQGTMNAIPRKNEAYANTEVQIIVNANEDYAVKTLTVKNDTTNAAVDVTLKEKDGQTSIYTFTMPASPVTVTATYKKLATNGYYLIGLYGWTAADIDGNDKFVDDLSVSGQMLLTVDLEAGQQFKVVKVVNGAIDTWYPETENNYIVDNNHAGTCTIYFRPGYGGGSDWHCNCIYVKRYDQYYLANATDGTIRWDDHLYINKEFNANAVINNKNETIKDLYGSDHEHMVLTWLESGETIKVVKVVNNTISQWLPDGMGLEYPTYRYSDSEYQQDPAYTGMVFVFFEEQIGNVTGYDEQIHYPRVDWTNHVFDVQKAYKADAADKSTVNPLNAESLTYNLEHGSITLSTGTPFIRDSRANETNIIYELGLNQRVYCSIIPEAGYGLDGTPYVTYNGSNHNMTQDGNRWYFTMPSADVVIHAPMKKVFRTNSVLLSGQIGVNFFVDLSDLSPTAENCYMQFKVGQSDEWQTDPFDPEHKNATGAFYGFTCKINAIQMADDITATLKCGSNVISVKHYSLEDYIRYYDRADSNQDGHLNALRVIRAMSDFGFYMQKFQFSQINGLSDRYTAFNRVYTTKYDYSGITAATEPHSLDYGDNKQIAGSDIDHIGLQLAVDSATTLIVNLHMQADKPAPTIKVGSKTLTVGGDPITQGVFTWSLSDVSKEGDPCYQLRISGISAHNLDRQFTIRGTAGTSFTITASAFSYANSLLKNADLFGVNATLAKNAAAALYMFHEAEVTYRENPNG